MQVIDLKTQLSYFKIVEKQLKQKLGDEEAETLLSEAVYLFSVGGNDYFNLFTSNSSDLHFSKKEFVGMVIGNLTNTIKVIASHVILVIIAISNYFYWFFFPSLSGNLYERRKEICVCKFVSFGLFTWHESAFPRKH